MNNGETNSLMRAQCKTALFYDAYNYGDLKRQHTAWHHTFATYSYMHDESTSYVASRVTRKSDKVIISRCISVSIGFASDVTSDTLSHTFLRFLAVSAEDPQSSFASSTHEDHVMFSSRNGWTSVGLTENTDD